MSKAEFKKVFDDMEDAWKERREEGFTDGYARHPVGTFVQKLTGVKLGKMDNGIAYLVANYVTLEGKSKGKRFGDFQRITPDRLGFIGIFFTRLELEPPEFLRDIPELVDQLNASSLIVKQKITHNMYVDKNGNDAEGVNGEVLSVLEGLDGVEDTGTEEVAEPDETAAPAAEETEVDVKELRRILGEFEIKPPKGLTEVSDIAAWVNEEEYDLSTENVEEDDDGTLSLFLAAGIDVEGAEAAPATEKKEEEADDTTELDALRMVCTNNSVKFGKDDTPEQLAERLTDFDWSISGDGLQEDEVTAMKKYGIKLNK